jgi:hypothetical protein
MDVGAQGVDPLTIVSLKTALQTVGLGQSFSFDTSIVIKTLYGIVDTSSAAKSHRLGNMLKTEMWMSPIDELSPKRNPCWSSD